MRRVITKPKLRDTDFMYSYPYNGRVILQVRKWSKARQKWNKEYFYIERGGPFGHYRTLQTAKKAVDKFMSKKR